ncbi:DUF397 domain-containing protein [Streptomyces sp. NPDC002667]|uniref:DUF397 domain-containing protein n=1 Tax=Streptomyces sp. NPDC002667 TaxID=3364657 RepID=UPI0036A11327
MSIAESAVPAGSAWFRSSYSNGAGGECVECAHIGQDTLIRDSKADAGSVVTVGRRSWHAFLRALAQETLER